MFLIACIKFILIFISSLFLMLGGVIEKHIIYKPSRHMNPLTLNAQISAFTNKDNIKLSYLKVKGSIKSPIILFCHGNDGNITLKKLQEKLKFLEDSGYQVYVLDYRGYGKSEGTPEEKDIYADERSFIDYLGIKPRDIILWGHSLGAAVAADLAKDIKFRGVILEGGFTSIKDMRDYRIKNDDKGSPVSNFIRDIVYNSITITQEFDLEQKISMIKSPLLIIHGKKDTVVPYEMGVKLAELNKHSQFYTSESGTHNGVGWQESTVLEFIEKL